MTDTFFVCIYLEPRDHRDFKKEEVWHHTVDPTLFWKQRPTVTRRPSQNLVEDALSRYERYQCYQHMSYLWYGVDTLVRTIAAWQLSE
jgi:hypothetical protein